MSAPRIALLAVLCGSLTAVGLACTDADDAALRAFSDAEIRLLRSLSIDALPPFANLKCDPDRAIELREQYPEDILPGYHMNKQHWNSVRFTELPGDLVVDLCQHSWDLIVSSLTKKARAELEASLAD